MHLAHRYLGTETPFSMTWTRWMFGLNWRRECRIEKLRVLPNMGFFPQFSQTAISLPLLNSIEPNALMLPQGRLRNKCRVTEVMSNEL